MKFAGEPRALTVESKIAEDWKAVCRRLAELHRRTEGGARCRAILARLDYLQRPFVPQSTWNCAKHSRTNRP